MYLKKSEIAEIEHLRKEYFNSMSEFQELFLELMIADSNIYLFNEENNIAGYTIVTSENIMLELFISEEYKNSADKYFEITIEELNINSIYCKSFDNLLLQICQQKSYPNKILGCLFRDFIEQPKIQKPLISVREATLSDIPLLLKTQDGIEELFETEDQVKTFVSDEVVFLFYSKDDLAGCGMILKTHIDFEYYDNGVWVSSKYRRQSLGVYIIQYLRNYCLERNWKPTCGCDVENIGSQRTLERSGYISNHKLIEFNVKINSQ